MAYATILLIYPLCFDYEIMLCNMRWDAFSRTFFRLITYVKFKFGACVDVPQDYGKSASIGGPLRLKIECDDLSVGPGLLLSYSNVKLNETNTLYVCL